MTAHKFSMDISGDTDVEAGDYLQWDDGGLMVVTGKLSATCIGVRSAQWWEVVRFRLLRAWRWVMRRLR